MDVEALLRRLERLPGTLEALLQGLPVEDWRWRPPAGGWSILEVVGHLVSEEGDDFRTRARLTLTDPALDWPKLDPEEVVRRHLARTYEVQVVGFQPGFAYLGPLDPQIAKPRLASPRIRVPACSVGIAGGRTGIYPFASPGGWNLIGTAVGFTPFDPERGALLQLGDRVRFERA